MADNDCFDDYDNAKYWLPPQFLDNDDDDDDDDSSTVLINSSPVESVIGSTETESDEEDFMVALTRKLAQSTLFSDKPKEVMLSGSPQSTLQSYYGFNKQGGAPPSTATWDLLYAAAGEVERMRKEEEMLGFRYDNTNIFGPPIEQLASPISTTTTTTTTTNGVCGFYPLVNQSLSNSKFKGIRYQQMKNQRRVFNQEIMLHGARVAHQMMNHSEDYYYQGENWLSPVTWPTLQQTQQMQQINNRSSGMQEPVFMGNMAAMKGQCAGTGVFLPRNVSGTTTDGGSSTTVGGSTTSVEARKKPDIPVLVPAKVVQALNMNKVDQMEAQSKLRGSRMKVLYTPVNDARDRPGLFADARERSGISSSVSQQRNSKQQPNPGKKSEIDLPSEWTY